MPALFFLELAQKARGCVSAAVGSCTTGPGSIGASGNFLVPAGLQRRSSIFPIFNVNRQPSTHHGPLIANVPGNRTSMESPIVPHRRLWNISDSQGSSKMVSGAYSSTTTTLVSMDPRSFGSCSEAEPRRDHPFL